TLEVRADDPGAVIFIDERYAGSGTIKTALAPGRYRVYAEKGGRTGRVREIDVAPGAAATLTVPWAIDGVVRTGRGLVGLDAQGSGPDVAVTSAVRLGRALGVSKVVIVTVRLIDGRRAIAGVTIDVDSQTKTFGAVQLEPLPPPP